MEHRKPCRKKKKQVGRNRLNIADSLEKTLMLGKNEDRRRRSRRG